MIKFEVEDDECETEFEDGLLEIEGPSLAFEVACADAAGKTATAQAVPQGLSGDNDSETEVDD